MNMTRHPRDKQVRFDAEQTGRKTTLIGVHCSAKLTSALDAYILDQYDHITRPEAIRKLLLQGLGELGYIQTLKQQIENAKQDQ